jgi:hypoxanthine phosphoribosyltransferase
VFDALPNLKISGLGFTEEAPTSGRVNWEEYWSRVVQIEDVLSELQATGVYRPDIIVGISNGGLFLADTSLRLVYKNDVPLIGLWAQRSRDKYFDNPVNNALINREVMLQLVGPEVWQVSSGQARNDEGTGAGVVDSERASGVSGELRPIRVLVMDDIVGTQRTFDQLVEYLRQRLGDMFSRIELRFVFLFTPRGETVSALRPYLLSQDEKIASAYKPIELEAVTGKSDLPYRKSIHYGSITQPDGDGKARAKAATTRPVDEPSTAPNGRVTAPIGEKSDRSDE